MNYKFDRLKYIVRSRAAVPPKFAPPEFFKNLLKELDKESKLGKFWCWHNWEFLLCNMTLGDKYQCKKCQKIDYND